MQNTSKSVNNHRTQKVVVSDLLAGKWTLPIVFALQENTLRYSAIEKALPAITQKSLTDILRKLERNGMLNRYIYPTIPPQVEYKLTPLGLELLELCHSLSDWSVKHYAEITKAQQAYAWRAKTRKRNYATSGVSTLDVA